MVIGYARKYDRSYRTAGRPSSLVKVGTCAVALSGCQSGPNVSLPDCQLPSKWRHVSGNRTGTIRTQETLPADRPAPCSPAFLTSHRQPEHPAAAAQEVETRSRCRGGCRSVQGDAGSPASRTGCRGGRSKDAPVPGGEGNPYDAAERPRLRACRPVTAFPAGTVAAGAAVLQRPRPGWVPVGTDAAHFPLFGMHDGIGPVRIQRSRDHLGGVVAQLPSATDECRSRPMP